ncbi:MAG TPA: DinB family protein [Candidatus Sulfotelmatobacter sp.]
MASYLDELYAHQEWADGEHWRAFEAHPAALADKAIRERLFHIHIVQHGFLWVTSPVKADFVFKKLEDFPAMTDLKNYGREGLQAMRELVRKTDESRMEETIEVPWFKPPVKICVRQALMQAALHSHYHRGQNATRLRELGGAPPMIDFIVWLRGGQPAARWE